MAPASSPAGSGPRVELLPLSDALERFAPRNPKGHDVPFLERSVGRFGFVELPVVDERTGRLVAGHGRLEALREMRARGSAPPRNVVVAGGDWLVPVLRGNSFDDDAAAEQYLVASNRGVERGGWVESELAEVLASHARGGDEVLALTGYDRPDVEALLARVERAELAPGEFRTVSIDVETDYRCPKCGYEWSGKSGR